MFLPTSSCLEQGYGSGAYPRMDRLQDQRSLGTQQWGVVISSLDYSCSDYYLREKISVTWREKPGSPILFKPFYFCLYYSDWICVLIDKSFALIGFWLRHPLAQKKYYFKKKIYLFIFGCVGSSFLCEGSLQPRQAGGHSSSRCAGLSLSRPLPLRSTGSRHAGSAAVAHGPSRSAACGIFPDQGLNPYPPHWQADSQPLRHQGSPRNITFKCSCSSLSNWLKVLVSISTFWWKEIWLAKLVWAVYPGPIMCAWRLGWHVRGWVLCGAENSSIQRLSMLQDH